VCPEELFQAGLVLRIFVDAKGFANASLEGKFDDIS
jgi:hypothetical protein